MKLTLALLAAIAVFGCVTMDTQPPPPPPEASLAGPEGSTPPPPPPGARAAAPAPAPAASATASLDEIAAEVNGRVITKGDLFNRLLQSGGKRVLDEMIFEILVREKADELKMIVTQADVDAKIDEQRQRFPTEDAMEQYMEQAGMTMADLRTRIETDLLAQEIAKIDLEVTDEEIAEYFEKYGSRLGQPEQFHIGLIQVETAEEAEELDKALDAGADFAETAKEHSKHISATDGGDLGMLPLPSGRVPREVEQEVRQMAVGQISDPITTGRGAFIAKLIDKQDAQDATLENSRDNIRQILVERKVSARAWRMKSSMRDEADVKVYLQ